MESKTDYLRNLARQLKLTGIGADLDALLINAQKEQTSYLDFAMAMMDVEISYRNRQNLQKRMKIARLPLSNNLDSWQDKGQQGISKQQLSQLRECFWMEQNFTWCLWAPVEQVKHLSRPGCVMMPLKKVTEPASERWSNLTICLK